MKDTDIKHKSMFLFYFFFLSLGSTSSFTASNDDHESNEGDLMSDDSSESGADEDYFSDAGNLLAFNPIMIL